MQKHYKTNFTSDDVMNTIFYKANGYCDDDLNRPIIGIMVFNEIVPGHNNLRQVADFVKGIYRAGGHCEFGTIACCDGVANGHIGNFILFPLVTLLLSPSKSWQKHINLTVSYCSVPATRSFPACSWGGQSQYSCYLFAGWSMMSGTAFGEKSKADMSTVAEARHASSWENYKRRI